MCTPKTLLGPSALTARPATHELSMPPERATTSPRRLHSCATMRRISPAMRCASFSRSMTRTSRENAAISASCFLHDERRQVGDRVEVLGDELVVRHLEAVLLLDERDELE